jgi:hypothetical protein
MPAVGSAGVKSGAASGGCEMGIEIGAGYPGAYPAIDVAECEDTIDDAGEDWCDECTVRICERFAS